MGSGKFASVAGEDERVDGPDAKQTAASKPPLSGRGDVAEEMAPDSTADGSGGGVDVAAEGGDPGTAPEEDSSTGSADGERGASQADSGEAENASAPAGDTPAVTDSPGADRLDEELAETRREAEALRDKLLRVAADFENFKKRSRRDLASSEDRAVEKVLAEVLPVMDNLERALAHADQQGNITSMVDGVTLVVRQFGTAIEKFGVAPFESKGHPFDPAVHEAMAQVERDDVPDGTVVEEWQKGYVLKGRLIRPAMVLVSKGSARASSPDEETAGADEDVVPQDGLQPADAGEATVDVTVEVPEQPSEPISDEGTDLSGGREEDSVSGAESPSETAESDEHEPNQGA